MKDFFIICLKYGFGNWQHMKSFATCLQDRGYKVHFILSKNLQWMNTDFASMACYLTTSHSFLSILWDVILFFLYRWLMYVKVLRKHRPVGILLVMYHPLNFFVAKLVKILYPKCQIYIWMHEPYKVDMLEYKEKALAIRCIEYLQQMLLPLLDFVILHSERALNAFEIRYSNYNGKVKVIPLLLMDECKIKSANSRLFDIIFIGTAGKAKGIESFFGLVRKNKDLNLGLKLQLITSSKIDPYLHKLDIGWDSFLNVVNKPRVSDEEIREACAKSYAVIAPYKETTQSGVVPVAFMCGTPVIGTDIEGLREYISNKSNGILVPNDFSYDDVICALEYIKANFIELSRNARRSFEEIWSDQNFDRYYGWLWKYHSLQEKEHNSYEKNNVHQTTCNIR